MRGFTIVIPVHNGGAYLRAAVASVLGQRYPEFELLVLDNASTDGSREFVAGLTDPRVRLIPSESFLSIEESWARITGVPRREFMTVLGHDDLLDPNYLAVFDALIERHPEATLYQAHFRLVDSTGRFMRGCRPMPERESAAEYLVERLHWRRDSFGTGYMMRSADYDAVGGIPPFPRLLSADDALWLMLIARGYKATAPEECFSYRVHRSSTSAAASREASFEGFAQYLQFLTDLGRRDPSIRLVLDREGPKTLAGAIRSIYGGALHQDCRRAPAERRAPAIRRRLQELFDQAFPGSSAPLFSRPMIKVLQTAQHLPASARRLFFHLWRGAQELRWWIQDCR